MPAEVDASRLPHWARVAFAARCAHVTRPMFDQYWSDAANQFRDAVQTAITTAEEAATNAVTLPMDSDVASNARQAAGRTQIPHICRLDLDPDEDGPSPPDAKAASVAALTATVAEYAVRAASSPPANSAGPVNEAYRFALCVAAEADRRDLLEQLDAEFSALLRVVRKGKWGNATPVPPTVFELLDAEHAHSRWWWPFGRHGRA